MSASPLPDAPTAPEARLVTLDILRGIALLGIFTVNMLFFSGPYGFFGMAAAHNELERWLEGFVRIFAQGAFYSLFSFLFGLGLALQLRRGAVALPRFRRRLWILLAIGLVHAIFIWYGDILVSYAVAGFVLTLFAFRRSWVLVLGALGFFTLSSLSYLTAFDLGFAPPAPWLTLARFNEVFTSGSYLEVVRYQAQLAGREILNLPDFLPTVLWLFLLGLLAGCKGLFNAPNRHIWWGVLLISLPIALVFKGFVAYWFVTDTYSPLNVGYSFGIGGPALMFVYLALLNLILSRRAWQRGPAFFSLTGRMALTHYLTQSIVCTLIFNAYGLGYFDKLGLSLTLPLVLAIYALQLLFSRVWLERFRFGPAEWLWRSLTYGAWQPLRLPHRQKMRARTLSALSIWPTRRGWLETLAMTLGLSVSAFAIGTWSDLLEPTPTTAPFLPLFLRTLIVPSLAEELVFRVLPPPRYALPALAAYVLYHPLSAWLFLPSARDVSYDPAFLLLTALLGAGCTLLYRRTGSVWSPVLLHGLVVTGWLAFLGGETALRQGS